MLVAFGWWPPQVEFDIDDHATVADVLEKRKQKL